MRSPTPDREEDAKKTQSGHVPRTIRYSIKCSFNLASFSCATVDRLNSMNPGTAVHRKQANAHETGLDNPGRFSSDYTMALYNARFLAKIRGTFCTTLCTWNPQAYL